MIMMHKGKITKQNYAAHYQAAWTTDPEFTTWIRPVAEDRMRAFCGLCRADFSVGASGIRAHAKGTHHKKDCRERHHGVYSVSIYRSRVNQDESSNVHRITCFD